MDPGKEFAVSSELLETPDGAELLLFPNITLIRSDPPPTA